MELNWTTFILESVNFLILVWILKRLFFVPIRKIIEERRLAVHKALDDAEAKMKQAQNLHDSYENRMKDWEKEKSRARLLLSANLEEEKAKQLKQIAVSIAQERERLRAQEESRTQRLRAKLETEAMDQAFAFISKFLRQFANPQIEDQLIEFTLERLKDPEAKRLPIFRSKSLNQADTIQIRSAYAMNAARKSALVDAMRRGTGTKTEVDFQVDPSLLAGVEISNGSAVLQASLRNELKLFSEAR